MKDGKKNTLESGFSGDRLGDSPQDLDANSVKLENESMTNQSAEESAVESAEEYGKPSANEASESNTSAKDAKPEAIVESMPEMSVEGDGRDADFSKLNRSGSAENGGGQADRSAMEKLESEIKEYKDKYLRALAELENYKKRALRDRSELLKYQGDSIFLDFLPVLDSLELALQHSEAEPEKLKSGVALIHKMFLDVLSKWQVRGESAIGKGFDPQIHSALSTVPTADTAPGTVINELRKAFFYKDKLLRPAEVVVAAVGEAKSDIGNDESLDSIDDKDKADDKSDVTAS